MSYEIIMQQTANEIALSNKTQNECACFMKRLFLEAATTQLQRSNKVSVNSDEGEGFAACPSTNLVLSYGGSFLLSDRGLRFKVSTAEHSACIMQGAGRERFFELGHCKT